MHATIALLMRIAIIGSGGVGGYFGGRLAAAGSDVIFIARGAHLEALRTKGLRLESPKGNLHLSRVTATDDPAAVGPVDVVLFTVKLGFTRRCPTASTWTSGRSSYGYPRSAA